MRRYITLDKKRGETPLAAIVAWKAAHQEYKDIPASYAGRLDPMATGKLLVLFGDECKQQNQYTGMDKEYEIEVLLDIGSDTGDALGIVSASPKETTVDAVSLNAALSTEKGAHVRPYPAYSSKTVNGKPLFLHTLEGNLSNIVIPEHVERIYGINFLGISLLSSQELEKRVEEFLALVPMTEEPSKALGKNFRIDAVRESWKNVFTLPNRSYAVLRLRVTCASGTYMRSLAGRIGASLGATALALSIHRSKIGRYRFGFWIKQY
jgi:tRNA pseudouridine55 synthase